MYRTSEEETSTLLLLKIFYERSYTFTYHLRHSDVCFRKIPLALILLP